MTVLSRNTRNKSLRLLITLTLSVYLLLQAGCSYVQIVVSASTEAQLLRDGEKAFLLGNYEKAEELFLQVYTTEGESQYKNTARYNLACTRMITAENSKSYQEAIALLKDWKKPYHSGFYTENPALIVSSLSNNGMTIRHQTDLLRSKNKRLNKQISTLEEKIVNLRTLLTSYQEDNITAQEMIETLQRQIKELEEIDQQLQEKKKPL